MRWLGVWGRLPAGWEYGDVTGVATDSRDRVYIFTRPEHPVIVFEREVRFLGSSGELGEGPGQFMLPHSPFIHRSGRVFACDRENNRIQIFSLAGEYLGAWADRLGPAELWIGKDDRVYLGEL